MAANHGDNNQRQEDYLALYEGISERDVRIRRIPDSVLMAVITVVTLGVLGVVAYKAGPWYVAAAALLVFVGYLLWTIYEKKRQGEGPPEPGDSQDSPRPND